jgi:hypothetical protein
MCVSAIGSLAEGALYVRHTDKVIVHLVMKHISASCIATELLG